MERKDISNGKVRVFFCAAFLAVIFVLFDLLVWTASVIATDTPGTWKLTGTMTTSRRALSVYTLPDGRILASGGTNTTGVDGTASVFYDTAEIYDPITGTWSATGSLTTGGRALHGMAPLPDGRIIIMGGWNGSGALSSAEIYNPTTATFSPTGPMITARAGLVCRVLYDGRILVTGGFDSGRIPIATAEIYDPEMGTFSATALSMIAARYGHSMNEVADGKMLIVGGFGAGGVELATAEVFDPATGTFTAAVSLAQARAYHNASVLPNGTVLVTGGHGGGGVLSSTEIYNPETNTFMLGPVLNQARQMHSSYFLPNGLVLISGGNNNASGDWDVQTNFLSSAELYDPATHSFVTTGSKNNATCYGGAVVLWNGKFLIPAGGTNVSELYIPEMPGTIETWVATGNMVTARASIPYAYLDDGRVITIGGLDSAGNPLASAETYDYLTGHFAATGSMATPRQHHTVSLLYTGKVLVAGGRPNASSNVLNSAELFEPVSGTFTSTGNMNRFRRLHAASGMPNGKVLIVGGLGGTSNTSNSVLFGAETYDPATGIFTFTTGNLITGRYNTSATLLHTGKVLVTGGFGAGTVLLSSAELYDPATDSFTATGSMTTPRSSPRLTRLPDGKTLVSGGLDAAGNPIQAMEIYDPATGVFSAAGDAALPQGNNRVSRLDNGKLIFVGGQTAADTSTVTDSVYLYNHATGRFSPTASLVAGRRNFALWTLPNGRVLIAGGYDAAGGVLSSAELYTPFIGDIFSDVSVNYWAYDYITSIYNAHITTGYGDGTYQPEDYVTREQMAAFLVRAVQGEPATDYCSTGSPFPDCPTDSWSCKYIKTLYELGLTTGYGNTGLFMPAYNVSREQMAAFLVRAVQGEPAGNYCASGSPFTDVTAADWSCIYIKRLYELGITTGYGNNLYGPADLVTRAQMAVFLGRAFLGME